MHQVLQMVQENRRDFSENLTDSGAEARFLSLKSDQVVNK